MAPVNPTKFVKVFNIKNGSEQVVPLMTWEKLSQENPKTMRDLNFLFNCDENGNRVEQPRIERPQPVVTVAEVKPDVKTAKTPSPEKLKAQQAVTEFTNTK